MFAFVRSFVFLSTRRSWKWEGGGRGGREGKEEGRRRKGGGGERRSGQWFHAAARVSQVQDPACECASRCRSRPPRPAVDSRRICLLCLRFRSRPCRDGGNVLASSGVFGLWLLVSVSVTTVCVLYFIKQQRLIFASSQLSLPVSR